MNKIIIFTILATTSLTGVVRAYQKDTVFYDEKGMKTGSAKTSPSGEVTYYDEKGFKVGSSKSR